MPIGDKILEAASELAGPFAKEQIFFSSVMDAARGIDATGAKVWGQNDTTLQKTSAGLLHILEHSFEPGFSASARRIAKGHLDIVSSSGRKFDAGQEWVSFLTGFKSGMSRGELRMLMKGENIGSQAVKSLMSNRYYRYEPTADTIKDGRRKGAKNGEDRVGAFNDIRDQHDRVQPLSEDDRES